MKKKSSEKKLLKAPQDSDEEKKAVVKSTNERLAKFCSALGTKNNDLIAHLLNQVGCASTNPKELSTSLKPALAFMEGIAPRDELEGLLATQMMGVHNLAMEFMRRAIHPEQGFEAATVNTERATKMLRTFTTQMEALNRYRGKGQQKVTVEHVTVNSGGQAIVGQVESSAGNIKAIDQELEQIDKRIASIEATLSQEKTVN